MGVTAARVKPRVLQAELHHRLKTRKFGLIMGWCSKRTGEEQEKEERRRE